MTYEFKLNVVQYADNCNNNRQTTRQFNVSEKQELDWRKPVLDLAKMSQAKKACRRTRTEILDMWTTDNRVMLLPMALLKWKQDRSSTMNGFLHQLGGAHISCTVLNWYSALISPTKWNNVQYTVQPMATTQILLILMCLICGFDSRGLIGPRNRQVLYTGATYTRVYTVLIKRSALRVDMVLIWLEGSSSLLQVVNSCEFHQTMSTGFHVSWLISNTWERNCCSNHSEALQL